jgi:hypothetical protein
MDPERAAVVLGLDPQIADDQKGRTHEQKKANRQRVAPLIQAKPGPKPLSAPVS